MVVTGNGGYAIIMVCGGGGGIVCRERVAVKIYLSGNY